MCWLRRPIPLGGVAGAAGCDVRAGLLAGRFAAFFTAFFAAGRLRAGALFFAPDFFDAFFRAGMDKSSFNERETLADKENDDAWRTRGQVRLIHPRERDHKPFSKADACNKQRGTW
jgi:hypothetical protein